VCGESGGAGLSYRLDHEADGRNERSCGAITALGARFEGIRREERPSADGTPRARSERVAVVSGRRAELFRTAAASRPSREATAPMSNSMQSA
jgi:hypothetical protein